MKLIILLGFLFAIASLVGCPGDIQNADLPDGSVDQSDADGTDGADDTDSTDGTDTGSADTASDIDLQPDGADGTDADPCATLTCTAPGAVCDPALARCVCRPGYSGDGTTCTPFENECQDDGVTDYLVCATNSRLIIIDANNCGETVLPGCAGLVAESLNTCRANRYFEAGQEEVYAIRLYLKKLPVTESFYIKDFTTDVMRLEDPRFTRFDMAVSRIPGDFTGESRSACSRVWPNATPDGTIVASQTNPGDPISEDVCQLVPGTLYYINVKPAETGCHNKNIDPSAPDQSEYPQRGCSVAIITRLPSGN